MALVLAGGRGLRLNDLTAHRAKPAVYFGGKFRIIDFALSNCLNSGVRRIGVITQYESNSLLRHLQKGWAYLRWEMNEFVELLPAQQQRGDVNWYSGTADTLATVCALRLIHSATGWSEGSRLFSGSRQLVAKYRSSCRLCNANGSCAAKIPPAMKAMPATARASIPNWQAVISAWAILVLRWKR